jgi:hypothetical protein
MRATNLDVLAHGEPAGQCCHPPRERARRALHLDPLKIQTRYPSDHGGTGPVHAGRVSHGESQAGNEQGGKNDPSDNIRYPETANA